MRDFRGRPQELKLPTAPERPIHVLDGRDRPQPIKSRLAMMTLRDVETTDGFAVAMRW